MERWIGVALGALALVGLAWNAVQLGRLDARLDALEAGSAEEPAAAAEAPARSGPAWRLAEGGPRRRADASAAGRAEASAPTAAAGSASAVEVALEDPAVRERLATLLREEEAAREAREEQERSAMFLDSMTEEVRAFADEHGLDAPTAERLLAELTRQHEAFTAVRQDVRDGNLSWFDARKEFDALREERDAAVAGILGEEDAAALTERLWGERGRRGPPF